MTKVSSITTEYSRTVQPAPYESQSARVSVTLIEVEDDPEANATDALLEVQGIVHNILGLDAPKKPKKSKPIAETKGVKASANKAAKAETKTTRKAATKPEVKEEEPANEEDIDLGDDGSEEEVPQPKKGDLMKAIQQAKERLKAMGEADTKTPLSKLIAAYSNKDEPPFKFNDIPEYAWADFIYDLDKLGR
jgi:Mn-containing catalase